MGTLTNGYWFCYWCNKLTSRVQRGNKFVCIHCNKDSKLKYHRGTHEMQGHKLYGNKSTR